MLCHSGKEVPPSPRKPPTPSSFFHRLKSSVLLFPVKLPPFKLSDSPFIQAGANQKNPLGFIPPHSDDLPCLKPPHLGIKAPPHLTTTTTTHHHIAHSHELNFRFPSMNRASRNRQPALGRRKKRSQRGQVDGANKKVEEIYECIVVRFVHLQFGVFC